jgi:hypothetical protein
MSASSAIALGGLQGIEFLDVVVRLYFFDMGGKVAGARDPFQSRFAVAIAIGASRILNDAVTAVALLYHGMTLPAVIGTPFLPHKDTLRPRLYRLTNHDYHLPSVIGYKKTRFRTTLSGFSVTEWMSYTNFLLLCQCLFLQ